MADDGTAQAFRSALGAPAARHLAGDDPPPRAGRRSGLPHLEGTSQARLPDHDQTVTVGGVVADRDPERVTGGHQRMGGSLVRRPPAAGPVLVRQRVLPVRRLGHRADCEYAAAAASGGSVPRGTETEQVEVAVAAEHRRAEYLLRRQPGEAGEDLGRPAEQVSGWVVLDQAEALGRQRIGVPGNAVVVVADEQVGGRVRRRFPGDPRDPRGRVGAGTCAGQRAARQQQALRPGQERLRGSGAWQGQRGRRGGNLGQPCGRVARPVRACRRRVGAQDQALGLPAPDAGDRRVAEQPQAPPRLARQRAAVAAVATDGGAVSLIVRQHLHRYRTGNTSPAGRDRRQRRYRAGARQRTAQADPARGRRTVPPDQCPPA